MSGLYDEMSASKGMREIFSDRAQIQAMLDFEAALARAEADAGVIPADAATPIAAQCRAKRFDLERLAQDAALTGNIAVPLIAALADHVSRNDSAASRFVHFGATSQDAVDTGLILQLQKALDLFDAELARLCDTIAELVKRHRRTVLLGRLWLQPTVPVTFGFKAAGWLSALVRDRERLRALRTRTLVVQFGGAGGTLAPLGKQGLDVATRLAQVLKLGLPDVPWHAARDRIAEVGAAIGLVAGTLGKLARDISLMTQAEVAEASEQLAPGRGAPSTALHKRTPVGTGAILAVAARVPGLVGTLFSAMPQEHERGLGGWQAEWVSLPEICLLTSGALARAIEVVGSLEVDATRMRANIDATGGVVLGEMVALALARHLGSPYAYALVERACRQAVDTGTSLREVLETEREVTNQFTVAELNDLCDPDEHLGVAETFGERALAEHARFVAETRH